MAKLRSLYAVSLFVHGGLALGVVTLREPKRHETIAISVSETAKKKAPEPAKVTEQPKPAETKSEAPRQAKAKVAPAAPKAEAPPPESAPRPSSPIMDALPEFGVQLGNGGPGGVAVPQAAPVAAPVASAHAPPPPRVLAARPADECSDPVVKPKPRSISQPGYTAAAREAGVEGRVRVEVSVGADGGVASVRLLAGLGHGLDEAALEAARRATFEPATRCGKPVAATFVIAMRFSL